MTARNLVEPYIFRMCEGVDHSQHIMWWLESSVLKWDVRVKEGSNLCFYF